MAIEKRRGKNGISYRVNWRNPHTKKIEKSETFHSLADARKFEGQIKNRLEFEPESFLPDNYIPPGTLPVTELLRLYLEEADMTAVTRKTTFYHVRSLIPHLPLVDASELKRPHLREAERAMRDSGVKQNTVQRRISILKSALNWAVEAELLEGNPVPEYRCRRGEDTKLVPPSPDELARIYAVAPGHLRRAILLSYHLGVRVGPSELLSMAWQDVDLESGLIRVWSAKKNHKSTLREMTITGALAGHLRAWAVEDAVSGASHIVHYQGQQIKSLRKCWATALAHAGVTRRIRPYDLRHAFATQALAAGADLKSVADLMGHASTTMIHRHYQHVLDRQKRATLDAVPVFLDPPDEPTQAVPVADQDDPKWKN